MTLGEIMLADARAAVADGETVVYSKAGQTGRSIRAIVERPQPAMEQSPRGLVQRFRLHAVNSSADGVAADEVLMTETVTLTRHAGGTETVTKRVESVAGTTPGWTILELI
jgi:hypothetical protein